MQHNSETLDAARAMFEEGYDVVLWFPNGMYHYERRGCPLVDALNVAKDFMGRPAATIGVVWPAQFTARLISAASGTFRPKGPASSEWTVGMHS